MELVQVKLHCFWCNEEIKDEETDFIMLGMTAPTPYGMNVINIAMHINCNLNKLYASVIRKTDMTQEQKMKIAESAVRFINTISGNTSDVTKH